MDLALLNAGPLARRPGLQAAAVAAYNYAMSPAGRALGRNAFKLAADYVSRKRAAPSSGRQSTSAGTKRRRTSGDSQGSGRRTARPRVMAKSRRYYPKRRTMRRRRKYTRRIKRRGRKSKYAKTRSIRLTRTVNRIPATAFTNFKHRASTRGILYSVYQAPSTNANLLANQLDSYVFRANDIVNPICKNSDQTGQAATNWVTSWHGDRTSVYGLNRVAPLYAKHQVLRYGMYAHFQFRMSGPDQLISIPRIFVAWRISDQCPTHVDAATDGQTGFDDVVNRRTVGWRYVEVKNLQMNRNRSLRVKMSIPITKFYKYTLTDLSALQSLTCDTSNATSATSWSSPANPCYLQMLVFARPWDPSYTKIPNFQSIANPVAPTGTSTQNEAGQWAVSYSVAFTQSFFTKSSERDPDISIQSTVTDGGADVDATLEDEQQATTATWTGIGDGVQADITEDA